MTFLSDLPARVARTQTFSLGHPRSYRITKTGVVFLRSQHGEDPVQDLWFLPITPDGFGEEVSLVDAHDDANLAVSPEEAARRERVRERAQGIVDYSIDRDGTRAVFGWGEGLGVIEIGTSQAVRTLPLPGPMTQPTLSPDGNTIAGVIDGALWSIDVASGEARCLAQEDGLVTWGLPDFIAAEEMSRIQGFWWAPDSQHLAVTRVDNAALADWWISGPVDPDRVATQMPYPPAGGTNATISLWHIDLTGNRQPLALSVGPDHPFEYLASVQWLDDNRIVASVQDRNQHHIQTLLVPSDGSDSSVLDDNIQEPWNEIVPGLPHAFIGDDEAIHLLTPRLVDNQRVVALDGQILGSGQQDWSVLNVSGVLTKGGLRVGATGIPSETPWDNEALIISHDGVMPFQGTATLGTCGHDDEAVLVLRTTTLAGAPVVKVILLDRKGLPTHTLTSNGAALPQTGVALFGPIKGPGRTRSVLLVPGSWSPTDGPLPVVVKSYGGPHARMVVADRTRYLEAAFFAAQGYAVIVTDGPGAPGGGLDAEFSIYKNLHATIKGQINALDGIDTQFPGVLDRSRVGICGWSYGGYLSARAVLEYPDVFKAGIAGAPVTDWRLYDTQYTERYLGNPNEDHVAYQAEELAHIAQRLDPETWPSSLLIIHGLADDNVVVAHTLRLSAALLAQGLYHEVLPLSDVTHFTPSVTINTNMLLHELTFLRKNL